VASGDFGFSVSAAGDVNNDGYGDVVVGASQINSYKGRAYVYYGSSAMDNVVDVILNGENMFDTFGSSVSSAGDVNGDSFDDVIVGANNANVAHIFFGGNEMDNISDIVLAGEGSMDDFGKSVSNAGDLNDDGFDDVIVGARWFDSSTGRAYVYFGGNSMDNIADVVLTGETTENGFAKSVSLAGDVNNDGFDDVIVGASVYDNFKGRSYIFFGGSEMDNVADVTMTGEGTLSEFGWSVSTAGDVNNDDYDDVIVGAYAYNNLVGRAYVYYGGSEMDNTPDVIFTGTEGNMDQLGRSVSYVSNANGDEYSDVLVGARNYEWGIGRSYVYYGSASMDNVADVTMTGEGTGNEFGWSVSDAGDVNNDGFDDIIVGADRYDSYRGRAYIYYGSFEMDSIADVVLTGEEEGINFGYSVSSAGDLNNDGFDDVIVGAPLYDALTGRAYIYYGETTMDDEVDLIMTGDSEQNWFGVSVSEAGDVNNDGFDDAIAGAFYAAGGVGKTYIYYGGNAMDNIADVTMTGEEANDNFGGQATLAGDVNNDGYDDIIVGAIGYDGYTGRAYIFHGSVVMDNIADLTFTGEEAAGFFGRSVSSARDVNNDGFDDVIVAASEYGIFQGRVYIYYGGDEMDNIPDVIMEGENTHDKFGYSVSDAGDVNNDGFMDVIVGAPLYNEITGRAYIFYGDDEMDNIADIIIDGENEEDSFGFSVSAAGDVNMDNFDDVIIGAWDQPNNGYAYVYSDPDAPVTVKEVVENQNFELQQNYPNPFSQSTKISFTTYEQGFVKLNICNTKGQVIKELVGEKLDAGHYQYQFEAASLPAGFYFYSISVNGFVEARKMSLVR